MKAKELLQMKLHQVTEINTHLVMRVPGGWIYSSRSLDSQVFVPYNTNSHNDLVDNLKD